MNNKLKVLATIALGITTTTFAQRDALFINPTGLVGMGTSTPDYNLTISNKDRLDNNNNNAFGVDNNAIFSAKNSGNSYERYMWPRRSDNKMCINYGSAGFDICNNGGTQIMFMNPDGNVGIGIANPQNKLQMGGNLHMFGNAIYFRGTDPLDKADIIKWNAATDQMDIAGWRGVTLGCTNNASVNPVLAVTNNQVRAQGDIYASVTEENNTNDIHNTKYVGKRRIGMLSGEFTGMELETERHNSGGNGGVIKFFTWGYNTANCREAMRIDERGRLGIGTTDPQAMLEVNGSVGYSTGGDFGYLTKGGGGQHGGGQNRSVSILASKDICTKDHFVAYSDNRIKTDLKRSVSINDLAVLNRLQVTDYQHIDSFQYGSKYDKGFIAQEVEKVYPEAVTKGQDFVPDIFSAPNKVRANEGTVAFTMEKQHHLKDGDKVRFITKNGTKEMPVTVTGVNTFSINDTGTDYEQTFVFGRQVSDFRMVDYDRVFTLNVSATQQLSKEIDALKAENEKLKKQNTVNESQLAKTNVTLADVLSRLQVLEATNTTAKR
ncbi:MAG: tail fiber protein [Flavipsychrobacter sp.]|nr:tail fiber protein [Flavipsychrobacter sp.]